MNCLDSLEFELQQCPADVYLRSLPFIRALRDLGHVVHLCFGQLLLEGWQEAIADFTSSYKVLISSSGKPISSTPKVKVPNFELHFTRGVGVNKQAVDLV